MWKKWLGFGGKERIFMDYASTTPLDPRALKAMMPFFAAEAANPSSVYEEGVSAKKAITAARAKVAVVIGCRPEEIFFTASGTESNNLAIMGLAASVPAGSHFVTTAIEHPSILEVFRALEKLGFAVTHVGVGESGIVDPKDIQRALRPETVLVSVMLANNEIGTIQPLHEISRTIRHYQKIQAKEGAAPAVRIILHTDASQAANYLSLNAEKLGADMMTLDASKFYGPKGVGILYKKKIVVLKPVQFGGGQESGLRSGTENIPGIVGAAEALRIAEDMKEKESARLIELRDYFIKSILEKFPKSRLNGDAKQRLPNNINICFPGIFAEFAVVKLDRAGIAASSASACNNLSNDSSSYVIKAVQKDNDCAQSSLRFTLGRSTSKKEVLTALPVVIKNI